MSKLNKRVERLEQTTAGPLPWLILRQDLNDPALFRDGDGNEYRRGVNWPDEGEYQLLVQTWAETWPPGGDA